MIVLAALFLFEIGGYGQVPMPFSSESLQLQQLIEKSEQHLQSIREILQYSKRDSNSLDRAARILEKLSAGIDQEIEPFKGTQVYDEALLRAQSENGKPREKVESDKSFASFQ